MLSTAARESRDLRALSEELELPLADLAETVGVKFHVEYEDVEIEGEAARRFEEIVSVYQYAVEVLGTEEGARRWMRSPVGSLDGRTPLEAIKEPGGAEEARSVLGRHEYGVYF